jgi:thiol-disulfide isomerase/thioredoxin
VPQLVALAALLVVTALVGGVWRARQGHVRVTGTGRTPTGLAGQWAERGVALGARATFLQLSAEVCSPCRATARVLGSLAAKEDGVLHQELDVDQHLDLVKQLRVLTTPTVLLLDADGAEVARASGAMTPAQAKKALALCG